MRRSLTELVLAVSSLVPIPALADHCQPAVPLENAGTGLRLGVAVESASYRTSRYEGVYQGLAATGSWNWNWLGVRAQLPAYRLNRNGQVVTGIGDVFVEGRTELWVSDKERWRAGAMAALTLPSGDASADLGMGHAMAFGGIWTSYSRDEFSSQLQLSYAGALAAGGAHAHHAGGASPLVAPMNSSELNVSLSASYVLVDPLRLRASTYAALPVGIDDGNARAIAGLGIDFVADWFDSSIEGQLPLIGDPFSTKLIASGGVRF